MSEHRPLKERMCRGRNGAAGDETGSGKPVQNQMVEPGITKGLRKPDFGSLRMRWLYGLGTLLGALSLAWIASRFAQEAERYDEVSSARIEAIARSVSVTMNGDRLAEMIDEHPAESIAAWDTAPKDLVSMGDNLHQTALANQLTTPIRTLRVRNAFQSAVTNRPSGSHPGAMEVVVSGDDKPHWRAPVDYVPAMGAALFDSRSTTTSQGSGVLRAFAPVKNSWGETIGVAEVSVSSTPAIWSLALRLVLWSLLAFGVVFLMLKLIDFFIRRHCLALEHLALETRRLRAGDRAEPVWVPSSARELRRVAEALEEWRTSVAPRARLAQPAPALAAAAAPGRRLRSRRAPAVSNQPVAFDLGLLIQQAADSARQRASVKQLDLRILMAERLPAELTGDPAALMEALSALLENAIKFTKKGSVTLRVARVVDSYQLRFEVADTGIGVAWQLQPNLDQQIVRAAKLDPGDAQGGLFRATAIAARLGGQLGFESQPGSGSRFWFTANFQAGQAVAAQIPRAALT